MRLEGIIYVGGLSPKLEGEEMKVDYKGFKGGDRTSIELPASQFWDFLDTRFIPLPLTGTFPWSAYLPMWQKSTGLKKNIGGSLKFSVALRLTIFLPFPVHHRGPTEPWEQII